MGPTANAIDRWVPSRAERLLVSARIARPHKLEIPLDITRFHGAFSYGRGWHPFVAALAEGPAVLADFYRRFQPKTLADFYFLDTPADGPVWILPWLSWRKHRPPAAEGGLALADGVSYYGPCTPAKVELEYRRLTELTASIRRIGYRPRHPIRGFVMRRDGESRFFIRGGKHRTAALAFLGAQTIPVSLMARWPMVVDRRDAGFWPMVRDGRISRVAAETIFDRYFDFDGSQQADLLGISGDG
jgi:hypothetical protein